MKGAKHMTKYTTAKKIAWSLLFIYSVLAFSIHPDMVPFRGALMTVVIAIVPVLLYTPRKIKLQHISILRHLIVIIILTAVSNLMYGEERLTHFVMAIIFIALIISLKLLVDSEDSLNTCLKIFFYPSFIGGPIIGLYQLATGGYIFGTKADVLTFESTIISTVSQTNANYTAIAMLFSLLLSGALAFRLKKAYYYVFAIVSAICIVLTFSRTTILTMIAFVSLFLIVARKYKKKNKYSIKKVAMVIVVAVVLLVSYDTLCAIVVNYLDASSIEKLLEIKQTSTMDLRTDQWKAAVDIVFSKGPLEFLIGFGEAAGEVMGGISGRNMSAHNFFFGRLSENGVIGFIASIALYVNIIRRFIRTRKYLDKGSLWIAYSVAIMLVSYMMISNITWEFIISITLFDIITNEAVVERKYNESKIHSERYRSY